MSECCYRQPRGWRCKRWPGHAGPCALVPRKWNVLAWLRILKGGL